MKSRARRPSCEHGFSDFIHEESARQGRLRYADFLSLGGQHGGSGGFLVLRMPVLFLHDLETDG